MGFCFINFIVYVYILLKNIRVINRLVNDRDREFLYYKLIFVGRFLG